MSIKCYIVLISIMLVGNEELVSQKRQAELFFQAENYRAAITAFNNYKKTSREPDLLIKRGISYLKSNQPDECIADMIAADELKSLDNSRFKYSAQAYFSKGDYIQAAKFYKIYLNTLKSGSQESKESIDQLRRCGYAKNQKYAPQMAYVENLGGNVNTEFDEFCPSQSPTKQERYYFSSSRSGTTGGLRDEQGLIDFVKGKYSSDMFYVDLLDGNWSTVLPFEPLLNTPKHDILQDFSPDGSVVYFTKSLDNIKGELYTDTFSIDKDPNMLPNMVKLPFDPELGDKDLFVFNDSLLVFAAIRPMGFGGYDLYYAIKINNVWSEVNNFGPAINSASNETSPCILKNGCRIFFSSDRLETLGGYDFFESVFDINHKAWSKATNLGAPLNSPGNDKDIEVSSDGMTALFSSDRIQSKGRYDLYIAYFKNQLTEQLEFVEMPDFVQEPILPDTNEAFDLADPNEVNNTANNVTKDFISKPFYFNENEDVINPANITQIKKIADLMTVYPNIKILLSSHYVSEGRVEYDLYFSIKRAEKLADYLIKSGVKPNRIELQGCGANFPLALPIINGIPSTLADKTNRRIDVVFINNNADILNITYDYPVVASQYRDSLWDKFNENNAGITFRVQFAKVVQMLKSDAFGIRSDAIIEKNADETKYTYTLGNYITYAEAKKLWNELQQNYFNDTFIVPYFKGVPLKKQDALGLLNVYPELAIFLKEEEY